MKNLYNKRGSGPGGGERHPFVFFAIGAVVILAAVFVIGLQVGRVVEKSAPPRNQASPGGPPAPEGKPDVQAKPGDEIRKELGSYSREAAGVPVVPPPDAKAAADEVEKKITFRESLSGKEDRPVPLGRASRAEATKRPPAAAGAGGRKFAVQAGVFRDRKAAENCRRKLEKAGYAVRVVRYEEKKNGKKVHRVVLGPFPDKVTARKTASKLKADFKINAIVTPG